MSTSTNQTNSIGPAVGAIGILFGSLLFCSVATINMNKPTESNTTESFSGVRVETETETIPYEKQTVNDSSLEYGQTQVRTYGVNGEKTLTYNVTYENDEVVSKELVGEEITKQPVAEITANGTKIIWRCSDATSYDKNPYNDNYCKSSTGEWRYVSDSESRRLDPTYSPGQSGHSYYNSF